MTIIFHVHNSLPVIMPSGFSSLFFTVFYSIRSKFGEATGTTENASIALRSSRLYNVVPSLSLHTDSYSLVYHPCFGALTYHIPFWKEDYLSPLLKIYLVPTLFNCCCSLRISSILATFSHGCTAGQLQAFARDRVEAGR